MIQGECSICSKKMYKLERYPLSICNRCSSKDNVIDANGYHVDFNNTDAGGGFVSLHTINDTIVQKEEHICFVNGIKCYADEARFGGIVIQVYEEKEPGAQ